MSERKKERKKERKRETGKERGKAMLGKVNKRGETPSVPGVKSPQS